MIICGIRVLVRGRFCGARLGLWQVAYGEETSMGQSDGELGEEVCRPSCNVEEVPAGRA